MEAIVAVYGDWGIGCGGTQPVTLSADRKYFQKRTKGTCVIVGRRTLEDFPGGRPLPNRRNLVLTRQSAPIPGAELVHSPAQALEACGGRAMVIGGASVYRQLLPWCTRVYVTRLDVCPASDVFFPNLDEDPAWVCTDPGEPAWENGVCYRFCVYERRGEG